MFGQPFYNNYPAYNPYHHNGYYPGPSRRSIPGRRPYSMYEDDADAREIAAQRRARKAHYLPDEIDDDEMEADDYDPYGYDPRQRMYLEAKRRQALLEQQRREQQAAIDAARQQEKERELKWQEELEQQKREDEERRRRMLEEKRREIQQRRAEAAERRKSASEPSVPINSQQEQQPPVAPEPATQREYTDAEHEAASRIQQRYRIHRSYKALAEVERRFEELQEGFAYPTVIDFVRPGASAEQIEHGEGGTVSVRTLHPPSDYEEGMSVECDAKLAYTSVNYGLHQYADGLDRLLIALDGIESYGDAGVRTKRKGIVQRIERESGRLEWYWKEAWVGK